MNQSRRGFLGALMGAMVLDPERLLWVPGRKVIDIPSAKLCLPEVIVEMCQRHEKAEFLGNTIKILGLDFRVAGFSHWSGGSYMTTDNITIKDCAIDDGLAILPGETYIPGKGFLGYQIPRVGQMDTLMGAIQSQKRRARRA